MRYLDQVGPGEQLEVRSWVVGASAKLLWIWHELYAGDTLRATEEILGVHVGPSDYRHLRRTLPRRGGHPDPLLPDPSRPPRLPLHPGVRLGPGAVSLVHQ